MIVIYHESQAKKFVGHLRSTYGDKIVKAKKDGQVTEIRCCDGSGVLRIEPFRSKDQFQGMEFSGAFVDEFAEMNREALDFLATRVRRP